MSKRSYIPILLIAFVALGFHCPNPTPRPPGSDGTSRWAFAIAQPKIAAVDANAELRQIMGAQLQTDGRLFSNTGTWSFVAWSLAHRTTIQATVKWDGTATVSESAGTGVGPGVQIPLTTSWADSPQILHATDGKRDAGATSVTLMVCNVTNFPQAPGQAVCGMNFNAGANQLVGITGNYIGPQ